MNAPQNFRTAFNGFHREDVVRYLEYITAKHNSQVNQLRNELEYLQQQVDRLSAAPEAASEVAQLREQLEESMSIRTALEARCAGLEQELEAALAASTAQEQSCRLTDAMELETYRRAERIEREARERAEQIHQSTNALLAGARGQVDSVAQALSGATDAFLAQLSQLQGTVDASRQALTEAAQAMGELEPQQAATPEVCP